MSSEIAIKVENLSKCYQIYAQPHDRLKQSIYPRLQRLAGKQPKQYFREFWALKDVSFEIKKGETVGIIGRNGSGKSTLLQMICGTLNPTSGSIETHGRIAALLELGSGFNPEFTGRENVYMSASILGLSREETEARFDNIIAFADIGDFIEQPVKTYSSGMYVRLAFAVIAHVDADILVIDEALAVGDAFFTQKCMRFLRTFMKTGTVLFVSHDTASIQSLCTYAIWLDKGSLIKEGSPKEVCEAYLEAIYESKQGGSVKPRNRSESARMVEAPPPPPIATRLATDIKVFQFDPDVASFGKGNAAISGVYFLDEHGNQLTWISGGETVFLKIEADVHNVLNSPIIGFFVKDRLGQMLFGDNTSIAYKDQPVRCSDGDVLSGTFSFVMPLLPPGDYSITVAIANGTQSEHEQEHWIHDAIVFRSETDRVANGIIGIPMLQLKLEATHAG
jgi:lipopolysaccharide transport system ATP-binding protein